MIRTNTLFLLVATAALITSTAHAQLPLEPETRMVNIKVKFGDLDLDKPADARILFTRLKMAAKHACGPETISPYRYGVVPASIVQEYRECIAGAIADAVARVNSPLVSDVYAETRQIKSIDVVKR